MVKKVVGSVKDGPNRASLLDASSTDDVAILRGIVGRNGISVSLEDADGVASTPQKKIVITGAGGGSTSSPTIVEQTPLGGGAAVIAAVSAGKDIRHRTLVGGGIVDVTVTGNTITVSAAAGSGSGMTEASADAKFVQLGSLSALSQFVNDVGFITETSANAAYLLASTAIPTNLSDLTDDIGFITEVSANLLFNEAKVDLSRIQFVAKNGNDTTGDGSASKPFLTIQAAIDSISPGSVGVIKIMPGGYTEDLVVDSFNNLLIEGWGISGSHPVVVTGSLTIVGATTTRTRLKDFQLDGTGKPGYTLTMDGTEGRHYFENITILEANDGAVHISNASNWYVFNNSRILGEMLLDGVVVGTPSVTVERGGGGSAFTPVCNTGYILSLINIEGSGTITHNGGTVFIKGYTLAGDDVFVDSTSNNVIGEPLVIIDSNLAQSNNTYAAINKTGGSPYFLYNVNRDVDTDTLTGTRLGYGMNARDITGVHVPVNYDLPPASFPVPPNTSVEVHLKGIDDMLTRDLGEFTVAGLPSAANYPNAYALVTNASSGNPRKIVRSDGAEWKIVTDEGATVS